MARNDAPHWLIDGYREKANTIINFIENPCDAPWVVYFETMFPALFRALLCIVMFDIFDIMRGYFRPRGLRGARKLRRGRSRRGRGRFRGIPEFGETIAKRIPGQRGLSARSVSQGVRNLWIIDGIGQRVLWYWLVVDVTVDFFYNWATAMNRTSYCRAANTPRWFGQGDGQAMIGAQGWIALANVPVVWSHQMTGVAGSVSTPAGRYQIVGAGRWTNPSQTTPCQIQMAISDDGTPAGITAIGASQSVAPGGSGELCFSQQFQGPATKTVMIRVVGGVANGEESMVLCMGSYIPGDLTEWENFEPLGRFTPDWSRIGS
jgi:muramidase (phage lysozyme)